MLGLFARAGSSILENVTDLTLLAALAFGGLLLLLARGRSKGTGDRASTPARSEQLAHNESLVESLPLLLWSSDASGAFDYLSPQWLVFTGAPLAEQLGRGWLKQLHADDAARVQVEWTRSIERAEPFDSEFRLRRYDGEYRWFKTRANPTRTDSGLVEAWVGTCVDIQNIKEVADDRMTTLAVQLQTAQRVANVGSFDFDVESGQVVWSDELYRAFGLEPNVTPPPFSAQAQLFDAESWMRLQAAVAHSVATGEGYELELTAIRVDGEPRTTVARAEVIRGASGKVERLVGTFQDITPRERMVAERNALSERLQLATSAASIGVWQWDIQNGKLNWDESMCRIYGYDQPGYQPSYEVWGSAIHPEDHERVRNLLREVLAGRGQFRAWFRIVRPSGEIRHVHADAVLTRDELGRAQHMTGVNWDVTEQQEAELALRRAEAMQSAVLASAGSAIITVDGKTKLIRSFNRAAEQLLGYSADEVVDKVSPEFFHDPEELRPRRAALMIESGEKPTDTFMRSLEARNERSEWTYIRKDGSRVPVLLSMSAIRDSEQQVLGYLSVVTDLSIHKQYEAELLSLNKLLEERTQQAESASYAKGMFLANMSHEIRTPIGAITGAAYLLGRTTLTLEQQDLLSTVDRSATVLLGMVNDVLDLSKIEAQQLALDHERFELPAVLDDLASLMHAYASGKKIELILDIQQQLPSHFFGDRLRLTQVFSNLAVNAIKFTERGNVRVVVRALDRGSEHTRVRFEVHDTGPGIDEALQARLFKPFSQAEQRGPRRFGGTGLGLAIVRELVTLMDGSVGLSSRPGVGSTFWCEIPLKNAAESVRPAALAPELRLLIIEDYEPQRAALLRCAVRLGFRGVAAPSGEQGLALLLAAAEEKRAFDIVLLDWQMPEMDGLRVLEQLRAAVALQHVQPAVILCTAYDLAVLQEHPQSRLADAVIAKPIGPSSLMETVVRVVTARTPERVSRPVRRGPIPASQRLKGVRILVADDSDINRTIARRILELEGAKVSLAGDGNEAVRVVLASDRELDVVLMDIQMPVEDGVDATARIRADARFADLPILALTAGALASERERALAAGMTDFITKPYAAEDLIARVRQHAEPRAAGMSEPPLAAPAEAQGEWSEVEGFSIEEARIHLRGDSQLFGVLVARLAEELDENPIEQQPRDLHTCSSWLHRVGGSAGILCATGLHKKAREAEVALHKGGEAELERLRVALNEEIARTRRGIAEVVAWTTTGRAQTEPVELDIAALTELHQCVQERDLQAFKLFTQLQAQLTQQLGAAEAQRLQAAIQRLDFGVAAELLRPIERLLATRRAAQA